MKATDLIEGKHYREKDTGEEVVFKYMGQEGWAIVCEPGEELAGIQSAWGTRPRNLEEL